LTLGLRSKLFLVSFAFALCFCAFGYSFLWGKLEDELMVRAREDAVLRARLGAQAVQQQAPSAVSGAAWAALAEHAARRAGARVTLVDRKGRLLGDSSGGAHDLSGLVTQPGVAALLAERSQTPVVLESSDRIQVAVGYGGGDRPRGILRLTRSLDDVSAARSRLVKYGLVVFVLAMSAGVLLSSLAAELAARPARSLATVARRMAAGDLTTRSRLVARDDLGDLGRALDQLAKNLSTSLSELRGERDRLSGILSGMVEGVLLLDGSGRIVLVNPALREMLLLGPDAVGKTLLEAIRHAELRELLDQARTSDEPVTREIEIGSIKPRRLLARFADLHGEQGQMFGVFVDVTEMRRLESMRRDFVANVSHELRTPVTAIRSAAETLQSGRPEDPQMVELFIGIIERNAARLQDLVEDVLDLSRIESRELRLNFESLELSTVYGQILSLFRERADRKGIVLLNEAGPGSVRVRADRRALEHVLTNLVDNAVKYCGKGASVRMGSTEQPESVSLFVADNGPGIDVRHQPRIFERFYRVDAGRSRELGGTGLGLSIVKHLVEAMGGNVQVESRPGQGTTFSFTLKKAESEQAQAVTQAVA
jgi:two-component system, OmpR family, phosphate regulon sensor histidine kinase PhoR